MPPKYHAARFNELPITLSFFNRIKIGPLKILDQSKLEHLLIIDFLDDHGKLFKAGYLRGLISTFTCNDFITLTLPPHQKRLKDTVLTNGIRKLIQERFIEMRSWLIWIRINPINGNLGSFLLLNKASLRLGFTHKGSKTSSQCRFFLRARHDESPLLQGSYMHGLPYCWENT